MVHLYKRDPVYRPHPVVCQPVPVCRNIKGCKQTVSGFHARIVPEKSIEKEINGVCGRKTVKARPFTGFNVWSAETFHFFETVSNGRYLIRGFTNRDIRRRLYPDLPDAETCGKTSRIFAKLRAHGLIRKIPHSRRYLVSSKGRRIMGALIETKRRTYPELAAN